MLARWSIWFESQYFVGIYYIADENWGILKVQRWKGGEGGGKGGEGVRGEGEKAGRNGKRK